MKGTPARVIVLIEMDDGKLVQRPLDKTEIRFVLPILQEFDGGSLKVIPAPEGILLENKNGN